MYLKRFGFLLLAVSAAFCTPVFAAITSKEYVVEHVKNQVSTLAAKSEIPTKVSDLENDSGFITAFDIPSAPNVPTKVSEFENDAKYVTETAMGTELSSYAKTATVNTELAKKANASDLANYATTSAMNTALAAKADSTALNALATKTELSEGLSSKQDTLTTAQQNAVDSGITAGKVSTYDGYAAQIAGKQAAGDYATNTALTTGLSGKQDTLTTAQQNAVNSGITAGKVSTYDGYAAQIAGKQAAGDYATNTALTTGLSGKQDTLTAAQQNAVNSGITADKVSTYDGYAAQISAKANAADLSGHVANTENPHAVTKAQVGLGNVQNVDQTNASNLTSGTVAYGRLPVGTAASTVAAGNDVRFNTIPTTQPSGTPPSGQVFIWFN